MATTSNGHLSNSAAAGIAQRHLGAGQKTLRRLLHCVAIKRSLIARQHCGRAVTVTTEEAQQWLHRYAKRVSYDFTVDDLAVQLRIRFPGFGSKSKFMSLKFDNLFRQCI